MNNKLLVIAGPTGVGKTQIALEIAKQFNGEIISCDSMQIYKDCDIGTAKIKNYEMQNIPHYMIDIIDAKSNFSVSQYKDEAKKCIKYIQSRNKLPILVGGTGLYIQSVLYDYDFCNAEKNIAVREKYSDFLKKNGKEALYELLKEKNPERAEELFLNDTKRVIRALEIYELGTNDRTNKNNESCYDFYFCVLNKERDILYKNINHRVDKMITEGLESEVKSLLNKGLDESCQCMQSIGYKEWLPYFKQQIILSDVIDTIKQNTRRYAKRQLTWFKHRENVHFFNMPDEKNKMKKEIKDWLNKNV